MEYLRYPNESVEYRAARNALLNDEIALRTQIEAVAAKRRALPLGGEVPEDYVFERIGKTSMPENVKMSELFGPHDTLILYSFMYGPERGAVEPIKQVSAAWTRQLAATRRGGTYVSGVSSILSHRCQIADSAPCRLGTRTWLGTSFAIVYRGQQLRRRLFW